MVKKKKKMSGEDMVLIVVIAAFCFSAMLVGCYHIGIAAGAAIDRAFVTEEELRKSQSTRYEELAYLLQEYYSVKGHNHDGEYSKKGHQHPRDIDPCDDYITIVPDDTLYWDNEIDDDFILDDATGTITFTGETYLGLDCDPVLECIKEVL